MATIVNLKDSNNETIYPMTKFECVVNDNNQNIKDYVDTTLSNKADKDLSNTTTTAYTLNSTTTGADDRIISRYVSSNGLTGYETFASGKKRCWARFTYTNNNTWFTLPISFTNEPIIQLTTQNVNQSGRFVYGSIWQYRLNNGSSQFRPWVGVQNVVDNQQTYLNITAEGK